MLRAEVGVGERSRVRCHDDDHTIAFRAVAHETRVRGLLRSEPCCAMAACIARRTLILTLLSFAACGDDTASDVGVSDTAFDSGHDVFVLARSAVKFSST